MSKLVTIVISHLSANFIVSANFILYSLGKNRTSAKFFTRFCTHESKIECKKILRTHSIFVGILNRHFQFFIERSGLFILCVQTYRWYTNSWSISLPIKSGDHGSFKVEHNYWSEIFIVNIPHHQPIH
jgi:hypothetical protein